MARGRPSRKTVSSENWIDKIQHDLQTNQSYLNLILGALIVIVLAILLFNYFTKPTGNLGPSQQTTTEEGDVLKENLPGKYTVKEGDSLSSIAQKYYDDMSLYPKIMEENNLTTENIEVGQALTIPKLEEITQASPSATPETIPTPSPQTETPSPTEKGAQPATLAPQTLWGEKITEDSYTVQPGDWLSKIASRAYGDTMAYDRIAKANNISNPDLIEVGQVLKIPH